MSRGVVALLVAGSLSMVVHPASAEETPAVDAGDTVVGEFAQAWPEYEDPAEGAEHADEGPLSYVKTDDGKTVRLDTADVEDLEIGATVEVTVGEEAPNTAAAQGFEEAREVLDAEVLEAAPAVPAAPASPAPAPASPPYTNSVTVVMVNPAGGVRDSTTLADVVAAVNGPVADFWEQETDGRYTFGVTASRDWIDTAASCEDPYELWYEVADTVGFVEGHGKHLLLYVTGTPDGLPGCAYGLGEVGWSYAAQASFAYVRDINTSLIAHELGHNLSLGHSASRNCTSPGYTGICASDEYGDFYDVMGYSWDQLGSLNVVQAGAISLVSTRTFELNSAAGTATINAVSQRSGTRAVMLRDTENMQWWLEYRPASGRDAWLGTSDNLLDLESGVLLRMTNSTHAYSSLLDGTPSPEADWADDFEVALPVGTPVRIHVMDGYFTVTVQSLAPSSATLLVTPTSKGAYRPVGGFDSLTKAGSTISVVGWALDRDVPTTPVPVQISVDGRLSPEILADGSRPDVGADNPGAGDAHGYTWSTTVAPGTHQVCVAAYEWGLQNERTYLGCRSITIQQTLPVANWEQLSASGSTVSVAGWAFDPDSPSGTVPVHVYVDGRGAVVAANGSRPDVGAAFGVGASHGFTWSGSVTPGAHTVCVYAIDLDQSWRNTSLGCRSVTTQLALPMGNWEGLAADGGSVTVRGWSFDPDDGGRAVPLHVYVDGRATVLAADQSRPDVGRAFPAAGGQHGFSGSIAVLPGEHRVCVYAIDVDLPWRNTAFGCRTVTTQMALPLANWEGLSAVGSTLSVRGWALDPDSPAAAVPVHVYVDGRGSVLSAGDARPDVGAAFPAAGSLHGFGWSASVSPGPHTVCVYAIDVDLPFRNTALGCRSVTT